MNDQPKNSFEGIIPVTSGMHPDYNRLRSDAAYAILSGIEDYCILLGTDALPFLREYIDKATVGWTKRPDPALVEDEA